MQSFTCFVIVAALATVAAAASIGQSQQVVAQNILQTLSEEGNLNNAPAELSRLRKSTYGSAPSVPSVPCPKNYLFSCQPNVAPVACAQPQHGYAGAYSAPVPTYAAPQVSGPGIPQELLRPIRHLNRFYY